MSFFDDEKGGVRNSDPNTSHMAANTVDVAARELVVRRTLLRNGPMTMEEVSNFAGMSINTLGPRFAPLRRKHQITKLRDTQGWVVKRPGASGSNREVYEYQPDKTLWLQEDPGGYLSAKERHNKAVEAAAVVAEEYEDAEEIAEAIRALKHEAA